MFFSPTCADICRIGIYGDEANVSENLYAPFKVFCMFLNVLHYRPRNVRLSRYLLFSIRSEWMVNPLTLRPLLAKITESLNIAFKGIDPASGVQLCQGGERFVVAEYRGDQEFMRMLWQHNAMWNAKYVCYQCRATASDGPHSYADVSDNPGWEGTQHTNTSFINVELPPYPCYLAYYIYNFWFSPRRTRPLVSVTFIEDMFGLQCSSRRPITCSQALGFILHQNLLYALPQPRPCVYSQWRHFEVRLSIEHALISAGAPCKNADLTCKVKESMSSTINPDSFYIISGTLNIYMASLHFFRPHFAFTEDDLGVAWVLWGPWESILDWALAWSLGRLPVLVQTT